MGEKTEEGRCPECGGPLVDNPYPFCENCHKYIPVSQEEAEVTHTPADQEESNMTRRIGGDSPERPDKVRWAVVLLYASLGIGFLRLVLTVPQIVASKADDFSMLISALILLVVLVPVLLITYKIWRGRNWARITLLVLLIIGTPSWLPALFQPPVFGVLPKLLDVAMAVAQIVALVLLFQSSSSGWFRQMRVPRDTA